MRVGVFISGVGTAPVDDVAACAAHAEEVGLDSVFVGDHLTPVEPMLDSTVVLAAAAAATRRVQVGYGVMILALRPVAWAAKQVAALQQVSGGRLVLGIGAGGAVHGTAGWEAVGVPYAERGPRTDRALELLPGLVAGEPAMVGGAEITLAPGATPPPVWMAGTTAAALRRTVRHADVWFPAMVGPATVAAGRERLAEVAAAEGRAVPEVAVGGVGVLGDDPGGAGVEGIVRALSGNYGVPIEEAASIPISGTPEWAAERMAEHARAGVTHLVLNPIDPVDGDWRRQVELIAQARSLVASLLD
ncbi:LLM class flavin-dependent oxidoreductase [Pseudonocardia acaciae]|uniref:LLM class flavin-dependent oxidoreductase n=1 Tax=Pseudonocardia acaciae TaxID=551276 RepID=UPI00056377CC|nr:LLM class flavin-dependent oxidoreductase [Pseudonocardia acaciae]